MKLTKSQISALARKISTQIQDRRKVREEQTRDNIRNSNTYKALVLDIESVLRKLKDLSVNIEGEICLGVGSRAYNGIDFNTPIHEIAVSLAENYVHEQVFKANLPNNWIDVQNIMDDIELSTIECPDVETLTNKILALYD